MPRASSTYDHNAILKSPSETIKFNVSPSMDPVTYLIYQHLDNSSELIKCDLCGQFVQLSPSSSHPRTAQRLNKHRNSTAVCQKHQKALQTLRDGVFINMGPGEMSGTSTPTPVPTTPATTATSRLSTPPVSLQVAITSELFDTDLLPPSSPPSDFGLGENQADIDSTIPPCIGQVVEWVPGSVWDTYAYQQHDGNDVDWTPIGYDGPNLIRLRSKYCTECLVAPDELKRLSCHSCYSLLRSQALIRFMKQAAADTIPRSPWKYLNSKQLKNMLILSRKRTNELQLKILNYNRAIVRLQRKLNDYQRIVMLISENKIAGVSRLLTVAIRNGASAEALCSRLHRAISGTYKPKYGWTPRELDIAFLIKAIGGPRLLYALQKAEGYPSATTLKRQKTISEVMVSVTIPNKADFDTNISALLGEKGRQKPTYPKRGQVIVIDGVALEESIRFDFSRQQLLGLCREHSNGIRTKVGDIGVIRDVANALYHSCTCHYGKDATVLGIAPITDSENYHVTPIILSSSCKTEKGQDLANWVGEFLAAYKDHPNGEGCHGPIYTLATDGESSFRKLRFILGLRERLDENSVLGQKLSDIPGLNLYTGLHGLLGTCDPKHIVKRFATMIRSPKGILVGATHVTSSDTLRALYELPGMLPEKAALLLNPADKQNVPKAVNLIQSLFDLHSLPQISGPPSHVERVRGVKFIAKVLGFFLFPFINVKMSLSEQLQHLSTYSHLITALYLRHGLDFMTSALIADSQAIVKNIIFTIARLQCLDPNTCYYILFEGTDRLENVFSHVRTQDHARNFDIQQLSHKLSIGAEIDAIFLRQKDLDRGHVRRNLINARGIDHMNPKSWVGNVRVGDVDIKAEYLSGRELANKLLVDYFCDRKAAVDFDKLFSSTGIDHLRPNGDYIGSKTADLDRLEDEEDGGMISGGFLDNSKATNNESDLEDTRETIDLESFHGIETIPEDLNPSPAKSDTHYLMVSGQKQYIPTIISKFLGADREKKMLVTTRGLRAQGVTLEQALRKQALNSSGDDIVEGEVKSGDLGAILTQVGDRLCLAVVEAVNFRQGTSKTNLAAVNIDDLDAVGSKGVTIAVQILNLVAHEPGTGTEHDDEPACKLYSWWWPQDYIQFEDNQGGPILQRHLVTRVPGKCFQLLSPEIIYNSADHPIWSLDHSDLTRALDQAWSDLRPDAVDILHTIKSLPAISGPGSQKLPYHLPEKWAEEGVSQLYVSNESIPIPLNLVKLGGDAKRFCHFCGRTLRISEMRNHVGTHLLKARRDVTDISLQEGMEIGLNPCGWCGKDGCITHLIKTLMSLLWSE